MVRAIDRRLKKRFTQQAKLMETAVRNLATFSAKTEEGVKAAFDLIQSEYHLTDAAILDLTLVRVTQMVRAIDRRLKKRFTQQAKLTGDPRQKPRHLSAKPKEGSKSRL